MGEHGQQSCSPPSASTFHGAGRHIEDTGGLRDRVALHIDQHQSSSLIDRKLRERRQELAVQILSFCGRFRGLMGLKELFQALCIVDRRRLAGGGLASPVETGIHRDAVEPCGDSGLAAEGVGCPEGGHESVLHSVRGFLPVSQGAQGHRPEPVTMPAYELTKSLGVAPDMAGQQLRVTE